MIYEPQPLTGMANEASLRSGKRCPVCGSNSPVPRLKAPDRFHQRKQVFRLVQCHSCSLVWLDDPPTPQEMPYHYGTSYHKTITASGEINLDKRWKKPKEMVAHLSRGGALLDIGCSSGAFLRAMKDGPWRLHGVEVSPEEAHRAELMSGAQVFVGDLLEAPFSRNSFDVITGFHILEHVHDPREVIRRVWELLKPGGVFYMLCPNIEAIEAYIFGSYWYCLELPRHLFHFSSRSLEGLFSHYEFDKVLLRTIPDCYVEHSMYYVAGHALAKFGVQRPPLANARREARLPWRVVRKAMRLGVLWPYRQLVAAAGRGPVLEAAFRKRT